MPGVPLEVTIPSLLSDCAGGATTFMVEAATLSEALERMFQAYPLLRVHLYDEARVLRPHVRLFYNADNLAWLPDLDITLRPGDRLHVLQAVSGG